MHRRKELGQYFTPSWVAEELILRYFPELGENDLVWEPTCGNGAFLTALPSHVRAMGTEIDDELAREASKNSRRVVAAGDFRDPRARPLQATAVIGNPPFDSALFEELLDVVYEMLPINGRAGFIIPAYFTQTSSRVMEWVKRWDLSQVCMPREIFPSSRLPLMFVMFRKRDFMSRRAVLDGFILYEESHSLKQVDPAYREGLLYARAPGGVWTKLVVDALQKLGQPVTLDTIYAEVVPKAPASNLWPKEKIRQTLYRGQSKIFTRTWSEEEERAGLPPYWALK